MPNRKNSQYIQSGLADWTFVCPPDYSKVTRKDKHIEQFFNDGMTIIPKALKSLGYDVPVEIPKRYRRHSDMMGGTE